MSDDPSPWEGECPFCGTQSGHLNNHIRPTDGDGHGPAGQYPDEWDPDAREMIESDDPDGGSEVDPGEQEGTYVPADEHPDPGPQEIEIETGGIDPRSYECPECGESIDYGATECDEGHTQEWTA